MIKKTTDICVEKDSLADAWKYWLQDWETEYCAATKCEVYYPIYLHSLFVLFAYLQCRFYTITTFFKRNFLKGLLLHFVFKFKDPLDAEIPEHQWVDVLPQLVEQEPVTESEKKHFISIQITLCFSDSKTSSRNMRA